MATAAKTAPNQKLVFINKEPTNKNNLYATINLDAMENAARKLNGRKASGFLLWCYLAKNQNGFPLALSNEAVNQSFGLTKDAYDTAVRLLLDGGFLVQRNGNVYDFIEYPAADKEAAKEASSHFSKIASSHYAADVEATRNNTRNTTKDNNTGGETFIF